MNNKSLTHFAALLAMLAGPAHLHAQNTVVTYQGRITSHGTNFGGLGQFKFALATSTNQNQTATGVAGGSGGTVQGVSMTSGGNGYTSVPRVSFAGSGGSGSGASGLCTLLNGSVDHITMNSIGSGYTYPVTVTIDPPPSSTLWSNDGTGNSGDQPLLPVSVAVTEGFFTVRLGDTNLANMTAIGAAVFRQSDLKLRIWFSNGAESFAELSPPQALTPSPYAAHAQSASRLSDQGVAGLRVEAVPAATVFFQELVNIVAGSPSNSVGAGVHGATISGGGAGFYNAIGLPIPNVPANSVTADLGTVSGGGYNRVTGRFGAVGGGWNNQSTGEGAVVPGGLNNQAGGRGSFAAGTGAIATNQGAFVWADESSAQVFGSTAPNQFLLRAAGGVGIGTANPQANLHVYSANNPTVVRVQSTGAPGFGRLEFVSNPQGDANEWRPGYIQSTDNGGFVGGLAFFVNGAGAGNKFGSNEVMRVVNGAVGIGTATPVSALQVVGTVTATAFNPPSDRNLKENFAPVSPREVLQKVAALPISRWNFKGDSATPHVGPMAQDFHAAFGLGTDDKHIATVDADGVALAAIQGLNQKVDSDNATLRAENAELKARLEKLEQLMNHRLNFGAK